MGIKPFDVMSLSKASLIKPDQLGYLDSLGIIKDESYKIQKSFVKIGWYLKHIRDNELYKEGGYGNIWECAKDQLGYSQSTASRFINICEKFSKGHDSPELDDKYAGFDKSQMIEMLPMEQEQLDRISPNMTVKQIRDMKMRDNESKEKAELHINENDDIPGQTSIEENFPEYMPKQQPENLDEDGEDLYAMSHKVVAPPKAEEKETVIDGECREIREPEEENIATLQPEEETGREEKLSPYGLPKTVYPEGSLITTVGCGHKYSCFNCMQDCEIRQEDPYCVEAPFGNPFPCTTMHVLGEIRSEIGDQCQFINLDLAERTPGSNEPTSCCKRCNNVLCSYRCARSKAPSEEVDHADSMQEPKDDLTITKDVLKQESKLLDDYLDSGDLPEMTVLKQKMIVAALALMVGNLESAASADEPEEDVQPEFPVLKNNDQRKEWLNNYKAWGFWYRDENIDVNYYKYDFSDGSRLIVAEYPKRHSYWTSEYQDEHYYHLLEKNKKGYQI
mgnify:CR=1 FL=1